MKNTNRYHIKEATWQGRNWFVVVGAGRPSIYRFEVFTYTRESAELIKAKTERGEEIGLADYF